MLGQRARDIKCLRPFCQASQIHSDVKNFQEGEALQAWMFCLLSETSSNKKGQSEPHLGMHAHMCGWG